MAEYVDVDEFGLVEVRCMICNIPIASRTHIEMPSRVHPGKVVNVIAMKIYPNYTKQPVDLSDGSYANALTCDKCEVTEKDLGLIERHFKEGWVDELKGAGKSGVDLERHEKRVSNLTVDALSVVEEKR